MITISIRDYTTEQLKDLAYGITMAEDAIYKRYECSYDVFCNRGCKGYVICNDLFNTWHYLYRKIKEREALEIHRDTQESK